MNIYTSPWINLFLFFDLIDEVEGVLTYSLLLRTETWKLGELQRLMPVKRSIEVATWQERKIIRSPYLQNVWPHIEVASSSPRTYNYREWWPLNPCKTPLITKVITWSLACARARLATYMVRSNITLIHRYLVNNEKSSAVSRGLSLRVRSNITLIHRYLKNWSKQRKVQCRVKRFVT